MDEVCLAASSCPDLAKFPPQSGPRATGAPELGLY